MNRCSGARNYLTSSAKRKSSAETGSSGSNTSNGVEAASKNASGSMNESGNEINSNNNVRTGRAHGNIGVTTSQQMLESEIEIARFNLYDEISNLFLSEFCIYTY